MAPEPSLRAARPDDWPGVEALLRACALPIDGAADHLADFVVADVAGRVVAVAGLETHGVADGLLRSVAVSADVRSAGLGRALVDAVERLARGRALQRLHLLTTTAAPYFARRGFVARDRAHAPASLQASAEFRGACPASATYMSLDLGCVCRLRLATPDDAAACEAIYRPIVLETGISFEWEPPSVDDFRVRIDKVLAKYPWLVALDELGEVAGFAYANTHRDAPSYQWSVNTSVFVRDDSRGRGFGRALYAELHRRLVALGYFRAFAGVALPNPGSVALHEASGYERLGTYADVGYKAGRWRDVAWFQKRLQPLVDEPTPPKRPTDP